MNKKDKIKFHVPLIKRAPEVVIFMVLEKCLKLLSKLDGTQFGIYGKQKNNSWKE
jgi:hypothetical protein